MGRVTADLLIPCLREREERAIKGRSSTLFTGKDHSGLNADENWVSLGKRRLDYLPGRKQLKGAWGGDL